MPTICTKCSKKIGFLDTKIKSKGQIICGTCYRMPHDDFVEGTAVDHNSSDKSPAINPTSHTVGEEHSSNNYPIESTILIIAGWIGVAASLIMWIISFESLYFMTIYATIIGISGILGSLMMVGFGRIIILLADIKNQRMM